MTQFKRGDRLVATNVGSLSLYKPNSRVLLQNGDIVFVHADQNGSSVSIEDAAGEVFDGGDLYAHRFTLAKQVKEPINVGDTVEVIEGGWGVASDVVGKTATVLEVSGTSRVRVIVDTKDFGTDRYGSKVGINADGLKKVASLNLTKPLFTIEGTPVVLVTTQGRDPKFPVLAYEGKATNVSKFSVNGVSSLGVSRRNLTNAAPAPVTATRYVNLYADGTCGSLQDSRAKADSANERRGDPRIGCAKLVLTAGTFDA